MGAAEEHPPRRTSDQLDDTDVRTWWAMILLSLPPEETEPHIRARAGQAETLIRDYYMRNPRAVENILIAEPRPVIKEILSDPRTPLALTRAIAEMLDPADTETQEVLYATAWNPYLPEETLWEYIHKGDTETLIAAAGNLAVTEPMIGHLITTFHQRAAEQGDTGRPPVWGGENHLENLHRFLCAIASNPSTPQQYLTRIRERAYLPLADTGGRDSGGRLLLDDPRNYYAYTVASLVGNIALSSRDLHLIAEDGTLFTHTGIIDNRNTREETFWLFHNDEQDGRWARALADSPHTPGTILDEIARAGTDHYHFLAGNCNTPPRTLTFIIGKTVPAEMAWTLPAELAVNPNLPVEHLPALARHHHREVRFAVVTRPHLPADILATLTNDEDTRIRAIAEHRLSLTPENDMCYLLTVGEDAPRIIMTRFRPSGRILQQVVELAVGAARRQHPHTPSLDDALIAIQYAECPIPAVEQFVREAKHLGLPVTADATITLWKHQNAPHLLLHT